ncbi:nucleotide exchange factor GrpE [Streptomyces sp. NBC_00237]|uniref:nucleotide exchange factor GrpE n=1 Tax=Streptomyces sp. NBC_00237 TaxID=2975687 RepID=UPI0022533EC2|nr:nucleotide exchange factor GrpE [Streptomyces sp. NBC_00237]MCX5206600.1 nucleotide exchange factor GrpE [Streptomyces sp. NBC_00237]
MNTPVTPSEHTSPDQTPSEHASPDQTPAVLSEQDRRIKQLTFRAQALEKKKVAAERTLRSLLEGLLEVDDILGDAVRRAAWDGTRPPQAVPELFEEQIGAAHRVLRQHLLAAGVEPMDLVGSKAVPSISRVVAKEPRASVPADTVLEERVTGFYADHEVLREALVVVAVPGEDPEPEPAPVPQPLPESPADPAPARRQPRRLSRHKRRPRRRG